MFYLPHAETCWFHSFLFLEDLQQSLSLSLCRVSILLSAAEISVSRSVKADRFGFSFMWQRRLEFVCPPLFLRNTAGDRSPLRGVSSTCMTTSPNLLPVYETQVHKKAENCRSLQSTSRPGRVRLKSFFFIFFFPPIQDAVRDSSPRLQENPRPHTCSCPYCCYLHFLFFFFFCKKYTPEFL